MIRLLVLCAVVGCVHERDADVFVVLPDVEAACAVLDAARTTITIATIDGEHLEVVAEPCLPSLLGKPVAGFQVVVPDLGDGYHRLDATVERPDGAVLGTRSLPFRTGAPVVVGVAYADLPGWPRARATLQPPACGAGELAITATPRAAAFPSVELVVPCGAPAPLDLELERGPVTITATAGACTATLEATVFDGAALALTFPGGCP